MENHIERSDTAPETEELERSLSPLRESGRLDPSTIQRTADLLLDINGAVEVRALYDDGPPVIGRFDDSNRLVHEVMKREADRPPKVFIVNLHRPTEGIPCPNTFTGARPINGEAIVEYSFLLVDIDPHRPSNTSSTEAQLEEAELLALDILEVLSDECGWPEPMITMSGNGFHLLFRINLHNSSETKELVHNVLKALAGRFNTPTCIVDTMNYDAARLWKLPGTVARKGPDTENTPHRTARIVALPDELVAVTHEHLQELVRRCVPNEEDSSGSEGKSESLVDLLRDISSDHKFFADEYGVAHVDFQKGPVRMTCAMEAQPYLDYMVCEASARLGNEIPEVSKIAKYVDFLGRKARNSGERNRLFIRNAYHDGSIYVDMCDDSGTFVQITPEGHSLIQKPPVHFWRSPEMQSLPTPISGGDVREISRVVNIEPESMEMILLVAFLMNAMFTDHQQPVLVIDGRESSGKTSATEFVRALLDPSSVKHRSFPSSEENLIVHARKSALLTFENVGVISSSMSDCLCRLSTGSGDGRRTLYETTGETLFFGIRPVVFNGISVLPERHDLLDRTVLINMNHIPEGGNRSHNETQALIEKLRPSILGALYEAVSYGLAHMHEVPSTGLPRMADFARLAIAAEPALPWGPGSFMEAYRTNRNESRITAVQDNIICTSLLTLLERQPEKKLDTTAEELLKMLEGIAGGKRGLPSRASVLGKELKKLQTSLLLIGIKMICFDKDRSRRKVFTLIEHQDEPSETAEKRTITMKQYSAPGKSRRRHPQYRKWGL